MRLDLQRHLPPKSLPKAPVSIADALAPPSGELSSECETERACLTKKRPHRSKEQWGRFVLLQWVPLTQPWGLREPLLPQPLRRALPERQERQRASEPASPRAWGDSDRPSAGQVKEGSQMALFPFTSLSMRFPFSCSRTSPYATLHNLPAIWCKSGVVVGVVDFRPKCPICRSDLQRNGLWLPWWLPRKSPSWC